MKQRVDFLNTCFDVHSPEEVESWIAARVPTSDLAYIVTPNVDHLVRLAGADREARHAYAEADLCICDSRVLAGLARTAGVRLSVVPGSDLVAALFARVLEDGDRVCLIGGSAEHAAMLGLRFPTISIVHHCPPMGLRDNAAARAAAVAFATTANARIILLAVGSPQQELLAWEMAQSGLVKGTALCIGASVDFLIGVQSRAPLLVQRAGFEWAWRLATQPRRLARRYMITGPAIFPMVWRWWRTERRRVR